MWWQKVRGGLAYRAWQARQHPDVLFGAGILGLSVVGVGSTFLAPVISAVLFLGNSGIVAWGLWMLLRSGQDQRVLAPQHPDWTRIRPTTPGSELATSAQGNHEAAFVWPAVDRALWQSSAAVEVAGTFGLDAQARAISIGGLRHHRGGAAVLFNDDKVRLASELTEERLRSGAAVTVQRTDYFSSLVTNELAGREVVRRSESRDVLYDGRGFFLSGDLLLPHGASRCSDHIGISAHAVTRDGMLVNTLQAPRSAQDPGRFAPAGSGSMDWDDLDPEQSFVSSVAQATRREVAEECGCDLDAVSTPLVLGYARLLHRGGKPEFFGLCRLEVDSSQLQVRRGERPFVDDHRLQPVDLTSVSAFLASMDAAAEMLAGRETLQWMLTSDAARRHERTGLLNAFLKGGSESAHSAQ